MPYIKEATRLFSQSFVHPSFKEKEIYAEVKSSLDNINEQINLLKEEIAAIKLEHITKINNNLVKTENSDNNIDKHEKQEKSLTTTKSDKELTTNTYPPLGCLRDAGLSYKDFKGKSLKSCDITGVNFLNSNLKDFNLTGCTIDGKLITKEYLYGLNAVNVEYAILISQIPDLPYINLNSMDLRGARLSNTNLSSARMSQCNLRNTGLRDCDLTSVDFSYSDLSGAYLDNSNLTNARLYETDLCHAKLNGATIDGIQVTQKQLASLGAKNTYSIRDIPES